MTRDKKTGRFVKEGIKKINSIGYFVDSKMDWFIDEINGLIRSHNSLIDSHNNLVKRVSVLDELVGHLLADVANLKTMTGSTVSYNIPEKEEERYVAPSAYSAGYMSTDNIPEKSHHIGDVDGKYCQNCMVASTLVNCSPSTCICDCHKKEEPKEDDMVHAFNDGYHEGLQDGKDITKDKVIKEIEEWAKNSYIFDTDDLLERIRKI